MKRVALCVAGLGALSACDNSPQVNLKNATGKQVAQAVATSGVMSNGGMIQPGLWESRLTINEMNLPGIPPQYLVQMKQRMAENRNASDKHCITAADVSKPKEDFFGADKSCKYDHFTMGGGKIDIAMVCHNEDSTASMSGNGNYTPTSYSIDTAMTESGGHENGMAMKMHVDAQRIGECTGKDD